VWNLLNCYLSGRHDFGVKCEPGAIFLRCVHCGHRSPGWSIDGKSHPPTPAEPKLIIAKPLSRVIKFGSVATR
jgi:hypothetical protein